MHIIIKEIPTVLTIQAIEAEILKSIRWMIFFPRKRHIKALKIVHLVDSKGVLVERFCLVRIVSESMKKQLIKSLNGRPMINRRPFNVSEFFIRHWSNDRRIDSASGSFDPNNNKRQYERRRPGLNLVAYAEKAVGVN